MERTHAVPDATVARLPLYHRVLLEARAAGTRTVSSEDLAGLAGVNAAKVRKDLSHLGSYGTRGVGYDVELLLFEMSRRLGLTSEVPIAIVGMGNLGRALANHAGFAERGFPVVAVFDIDHDTAGRRLAGLQVDHPDRIASRVAELGIGIGVIATPPAEAQEIVDRLVAAGVRSILSFAPTLLHAPPDVSIRQVDLTLELQVLSFYLQRVDGDRAPR